MSRKRFFLDTEFYDDGRVIEFISIGIVSEDDECYYGVSNEFDESSCDDWVRDNVVAKLPPMQMRKSKSVIKKEIIKFLGKKPRFWVYNGAYDWVVFCQIFGTMRDLPKTYPWFANELKQYRRFIKAPEFPDWPETEKHNALTDAKWNKAAYEYYKQYEQAKLESL